MLVIFISFCPPVVHPHEINHYKNHQQTHNLSSIKSVFSADFTLILHKNWLFTDSLKDLNKLLRASSGFDSLWRRHKRSQDSAVFLFFAYSKLQCKKFTRKRCFCIILIKYYSVNIFEKKNFVQYVRS